MNQSNFDFILSKRRPKPSKPERHIMKYKVQKHRKLKSGMIDNSITEDILM
jgi:hypothetical protein